MRSLAIVFVAHFFHPVHNFPVFLFLDSNMSHRCGWCGTVPVFFAGRKPDHVTGPDLLDRATFALGPPAARGNDESLTERMCVPRRPGARLECYACALHKGRIRRLKKRIDSYRAGEPIYWSFPGGL